MGPLRVQNQLDFLIQHYSGRPAAKLDPEIRIILRLGIYQLRYLDRIPRHAAVSESVDLVFKARKRSASGLVNAVLRKVNRDPVAWPDRPTALAHPGWLIERWDRHYGPETTDTIARANLATPDTYLHIGDKAVPDSLEVEPTDVPGAYRLISGDPAGFRIQDVGSQSIVPLLDLAPGQTLLDLCASPGNKTAQALESGVLAIACDRHASRMEPLRRLGCPLVQLDGTNPLPFRAKFDRILLDAPCSGTGTLGRNPEIKWRIQASDLRELAERQQLLLKNALACLAPGGQLVYSTCSLESEENEGVVERVTAGRELVAKRTQTRVPGQHLGDGFFAAVIA